jgi:hypothetical protein
MQMLRRTCSIKERHSSIGGGSGISSTIKTLDSKPRQEENDRIPADDCPG